MPHSRLAKTTRPSLFIVSADPASRQRLCDQLARHHFTATPFASAAAALDSLRATPPAALIFDAACTDPSEPGALALCGQLRAGGHRLPVILLGTHSDAIDRAIALEAGADDHLSRTAPLRELLASLRALLRRAGYTAQPQEPRPPPGSPGSPGSPGPSAPPGDSATALPPRGIPIGSTCFEAATGSLRQGNRIRLLSAVEAALLAELTAHPCQPVSRQRLHEVAHPEQRVLLRAVDAAIMRLRRAVEPDPELPRYIQTVRGTGYMFTPAPTP